MASAVQETGGAGRSLGSVHRSAEGGARPMGSAVTARCLALWGLLTGTAGSGCVGRSKEKASESAHAYMAASASSLNPIGKTKMNSGILFTVTYQTFYLPVFEQTSSEPACVLYFSF